MDEVQLLIVRWGGEKYGIPIGDIIGIVSNAGTKPVVIPKYKEKMINLQGGIPQFLNVGTELEAVGSKFTLIVSSNEIQVAIMVDEIINVIEITNSLEKVWDAKIATFKIWKF